ncbi:ligand-binding sensor domain-containing protein [Puia sp. P3]|uniref:ligand-binding sensor domain-containing protein n=1 Tax=Puia sp. P3 TaxID=3423952 RepID=UPI003D66B6E4
MLAAFGVGHAVLYCVGSAQAAQVHTYRIGGGLSQSNVITVLQDRRGFMWFGTWDGLNRYDGYKMSVYRNDPNDSSSLSDNHILQLLEDSAGNIWVATADGGLNRFDRERDRFVHYRSNNRDPGSISDNSITSLCQWRRRLPVGGNAVRRPQQNELTYG